MSEACKRPLTGPAFNPYFALVVGVLAVSTGAIFVRLATDAPALVQQRGDQGADDALPAAFVRV
jgi:hypothetical protein